MSLPTVSVIVPARDAGRTIQATLSAISDQDYSGPIETVVACALPDDGTREVAIGMGCTVVENPAGTTPEGLNRAIAASSGSIIVRCDAHAILPPDYVSAAVEVLQETGAANVGGVQAPSGDTLIQRAIGIAQSTPLGVGDARYRLGGEPGPVDTVYLGVYRREAVEAVGLFDPAYERNQDYELNWRLRQAGETVWFDPRLRVDYKPRSSIGALARQYYDYGRWKRRMIRANPQSVQARQLAPPLLVIALAASAVLAFTSWSFLGAVTPGLYLMALGATTLVELVRRGDPAALLLPLVVPTMHVSWGAGFLASTEN